MVIYMQENSCFLTSRRIKKEKVMLERLNCNCMNCLLVGGEKHIFVRSTADYLENKELGSPVGTALQDLCFLRKITNLGDLLPLLSTGRTNLLNFVESVYYDKIVECCWRMEVLPLWNFQKATSVKKWAMLSWHGLVGRCTVGYCTGDGFGKCEIPPELQRVLGWNTCTIVLLRWPWC